MTSKNEWPVIGHDNNFDVIRLFAALQVVFLHASVHMKVPLPAPVEEVLRLFPGVPIFFFISGLLVISSAVHRPLGKYAASRIRRVFPALWTAFALAVLILVVFGQIGRNEILNPIFWIWSFTQISIFQVFNPDMFRDFGVGVVNGSLWTIPVEIGFYIILPVILWLSRGSRRSLSILLITGATLSFLIGHYIKNTDETIFLKLISVTPIAHFWLFALGSLAYINLDKLGVAAKRLSCVPAGWALPIGIHIVFGLFLAPRLPSLLAEVMTSILLIISVFSAGLVAKSIVKVLRGNDISYGLYVYHMLAVNVMLALGFSGLLPAIGALVASMVVAFLSWRYLESVALGRRKMTRSPEVIAQRSEA